MGGQSRQIHMNLDTVGPDPRMSAAAVPNNVHTLESETLVPAAISEGSTNATKPMEVTDNTVFVENDTMEPIKADSTTLLVSALDENAKNLCLSVNSTAKSTRQS